MGHPPNTPTRSTIPADLTADSPDRLRTSGGFTFLELLLVIVVLGVLSLVVVVAVRGTRGKGEEGARVTDQRTIETAQEAHKILTGSYTDESGLLIADLLRNQSSIHDVSLAPDGSSYTIVPAGSGGTSGGGGGNGGVSAQTIGAFDATVYNQGGSPVIVVFSRNSMAASLASLTGSMLEEVIWFNDADIDTLAEANQALGTVAHTGVFADATDAGWGGGSAAQAIGGTAIDGWAFSGDVGGLLAFGPTGVGSGVGAYQGRPVTTFGSGPSQVIVFPADAADVAQFDAFVLLGQPVPGVTLNLMALPSLSPSPPPPAAPTYMEADIPALVGGAGFDIVGGFDALLINDLTTTFGAPYPAVGAVWSNGDLDTWVTDQVDVFDGKFVTGVLI